LINVAKNTTNQTSESTLFSVQLPVLIIAGGVVLYFLGLGLPFFGPDEPRYAQVAREMFGRGDWVTPTLGGYHWFEKPALLYWLEMAAFTVFGVSEFAARLGPALFGLGTTASVWMIGRSAIRASAVDGDRTDHSPIWLALMSITTLGIVVFSRGASFDITVTFPLTAALASYFIYDVSSSNRDQPRSKALLPLVLFYVFIGVALLAKGLIGFVFPIAIVVFYHLISLRRPSNEFIFSLFWGAALAVVVASLWYLPMYLKHGWEFIDEFFVQHHFQRYTSNKYQHPQPFHFYLWVLPLLTLPWVPFFLGGLWRTSRNIWNRLGSTEPKPCPTFKLGMFAFAWMIVPIVFFSFSGSKLPGYILPAVPPAIILAWLFIRGRLREQKKWQTAVLALSGLVVLTCGVLLFTVVPKFADGDSVRGLFEAANERGLNEGPVYGLHMISHSAEFYAAGRLLREPDGKQKKLYNPAEVLTEMARVGAMKAVVLVPMEYKDQLLGFGGLRTTVIRDNGETVIAQVER
jgi:4-amino-4-deoxy-L-arabinose transferase-like glycosyltransferase